MNPTARSPTFSRMGTFTIALIVLATATLSAGCTSRKPPAEASSSIAAAAWLEPPAAPPTLAPPPEARLVAHFHATGAQVYVCKTSPQGAFAWALKAPDAALFDASGAEVGRHGAGPSWSSNDGSHVTAKKLAQAEAPRPDAIPWLLLEVASSSGKGILSQSSYVQRVDTAHGKTPTDGCLGATLDSEVRISYSAEYYFYAGKRRPTAPDAGLR